MVVNEAVRISRTMEYGLNVKYGTFLSYVCCRDGATSVFAMV